MDNTSWYSYACVVPSHCIPGLDFMTNRIRQKWWYTSLLRIGYERYHDFHLGLSLSLSLSSPSLHPLCPPPLHPLVVCYVEASCHVWTGPRDEELKLPANSQVNELGSGSASTREAFSCLQPWANSLTAASSETLSQNHPAKLLQISQSSEILRGNKCLLF